MTMLFKPNKILINLNVDINKKYKVKQVNFNKNNYLQKINMDIKLVKHNHLVYKIFLFKINFIKQ